MASHINSAVKPIIRGLAINARQISMVAMCARPNAIIGHHWHLNRRCRDTLEASKKYRKSHPKDLIGIGNNLMNDTELKELL